ncbi:hypothetical protein [Falsiporphyromonas endometrii]|uniref:Uncharacterized protein n=1 Tax=Falsiporphyromonas endometrii TaxID=1387297 RepID=A0ABV9KA74_9PORP
MKKEKIKTHIDLELIYKESIKTAMKLESILDEMVIRFQNISSDEQTQETGQKLLAKMAFVSSALSSAISTCESLIPFNKNQEIAMQEVSKLGTKEIPNNVAEIMDTTFEAIMKDADTNTQKDKVNLFRY